MSTSTTPGDEPTKKRRFGRKKKKVKDPSKPGRIAQFRQVLSMTRKADPAAIWWMLLSALAVMLVAVLVGLWLDQLVYLIVIGLPMALLAAVVVLGKKAERAAFTQIEGQPGATSAVLGQLRRGWFYDQEPVAAEASGTVRGMRDLHNAAMVFRAVGRPGVVLLGEGPRGAAQRLLAAERKRVARVVGETVPVHTIMVGKGEDDTALRGVVKKMRSLPKQLTNDEAMVVQQRMKALGGKNRPPIPAGVDPTRTPRMSRRALRGR